MLNEKFFELANREDTTTLTAVESKAVESLRKEYGNELANSAKTILSLDKAVNGTHIIKAYSIVNAINKYNSTCANPKKQRSARTAFSSVTGISTTDISRYFSIVTLINNICDLCADMFAPVDEMINAVDEKERAKQVEKLTLNAVESYLTKFDYIKVVELAKMKENDIAYILEKSKDDLPNYSKSELIFILDAFRLDVIPKHGVQHEYELRIDWLAKGKKIKDYDKQLAPVQDNSNDSENKSTETDNKSTETDNKSTDNDNKSNDSEKSSNDNKSNVGGITQVKSIPTTASELAEIELSFGSNSIGKLADSTTWDNLFEQLNKIGVMDVFTKFAYIYCEKNNLNTIHDMIECKAVESYEMDENGEITDTVDMVINEYDHNGACKEIDRIEKSEEI